MSRFSREQLETLTKVFADHTTNSVAAAGGVTVRELAQTALDGLAVIGIARGGCHTGCAAKPYGHIDECALGQAIAAYDAQNAQNSQARGTE